MLHRTDAGKPASLHQIDCMHHVKQLSGTLISEPLTRLQVLAAVDKRMRQRVRSNHTATHLLQAALKAVLGPDVSQQGSLVDFDRLRFDFNLPQAMTVRRVPVMHDAPTDGTAGCAWADHATPPLGGMLLEPTFWAGGFRYAHHTAANADFMTSCPGNSAQEQLLSR